MGTCLALAVIPLIATALGAMERARDQSMTTLLAASKLDQLRALDWAFVPAGGGAVLAASDLGTDLSGAWPGPGGAGLAPSPADSLTQDTPGYVDFLDREGRWVGAGPGVPQAARYVRRWAVAPAPWDPLNGLVLWVMASPLDAERAAGPRQAGVRLPGEAWVTGVRARTLR